jgi:hypothetical protein
VVLLRRLLATGLFAGDGEGESESDGADESDGGDGVDPDPADASPPQEPP